MMMPMKRVVLLLLLCALAWSQNADHEPSSFEKLVSDSKDFIKEGADAIFGWAYQQGSCDDPWLRPTAAGNVVQWDLLTPSILILLTVVFFTTIVYLLGELLQVPNLIAMAKEEYWQSFLTFLRFVFIFSMITAGNIWFGSTLSFSELQQDEIYSGTLSPLHIDLAMAFAKKMIYEISTDIGFLLLYNTIIYTISSATMYFGVTWRAMWTFQLGPVLKPLIDLLGMILQLLFVAAGEWVLHLVMLCAIKKWTWSFFIPLALLIRSFPLTRGGGDALLALFLAFAFFYPLMFLVDAESYRVMSIYLTNSEDILSSFVGGSVLGAIMIVLLTGMLLGGVFIPFMLNAALVVAFELVKKAVFYIVIMSLVLPFINIFVTLTAARETAKFFGVDVNFMAFMRLI